jgi:simple sugar transport system ATP-binding protein
VQRNAEILAALLQLKDITRDFGTVRALDGVCFEAAAGEVHALLGENGAGKTTLMNVAFGFVRPDCGEIVFDGRRYTAMTPQVAMAAGIGMVHQHFKLVEEFTVAENVALGSSDYREALRPSDRSRLKSIIRATGLEVDPSAVVEDLPVGLRQRVEILKALFRGSRLLILDEPTAVLTPRETEDLFRVLLRLREQGTGIVLITHKLDEALSLSDRVTVLRNGKTVLSRPAAEVTQAEVASAMVGRELDSGARDLPTPQEDILLEARGLSSPETGQQPAQEISFALRAGEILGIAGVEGNGQTALADLLAGVLAPASGSLLLAGRDVSREGVAGRLRAGLAHIPGDRQTQALLLEFPLRENLLLGRWPLGEFLRGPFLDVGALSLSTREAIEAYGIRGATVQTPAMSLSGGNQQRFVVARQMGAKPRVIVAVNPTRGLDVGAIEYVHARLVEHCERGGAVVLISTDLDEVLALSHRILVLYRGRVAAEYPRGARREDVGLAMATGRAA